jgi:aryl-alcohol dehydrogenase-like predicted oxidoreductase
MIEKIPFGKTGHSSSRVIFGAAALWGMKQAKADRVVASAFDHGVNHIDTAAAYGHSEIVLADFLADHRDDVFLATKTGERSGDGARAGLEASLERMRVDRVDLIQLHNLVDERDWHAALSPGGALEALIAARDEGLTRFIGVTGHGFRVAAMHLRSLERWDFASVLLPCNASMLAQPEYARDFAQLLAVCKQRGVAVQTIKSVARRRWPARSEGPRFSWYEPLRDVEAVARAVRFVLSQPGLFLNSSSDASLLPAILDAAATVGEHVSDAELAEDAARFGIEPLFTADGPQDVS